MMNSRNHRNNLPDFGDRYSANRTKDRLRREQQKGLQKGQGDNPRDRSDRDRSDRGNNNQPPMRSSWNNDQPPSSRYILKALLLNLSGNSVKCQTHGIY